ncbi:MAG: hypothetical protein QS99_C0012G0050 [archaeon GW2011_AR4]|nr:MAG: hypothetical protein QS99_C0012G0050 [archaeon GW2011_AR4]
MLSEKNIKEAESHVRLYLGEDMLRHVKEKNPLIMKTLTKNSPESIKVAELLFEGNHSDLWTIVSAYYSMFYIANAVLYMEGFKVGEKIPHKVTADALIVFIRKRLADTLIEEYEKIKDDVLPGIKADEIIDAFDHERSKRNFLQYTTTEEVKREKANTSLIRAKEFVYEMNSLIRRGAG